MQQLDATVSASLQMIEEGADPADPDLLAADRQVAAAAQRAAALSRALEAAASPKVLTQRAHSSSKPSQRRSKKDA